MTEKEIGESLTAIALKVRDLSLLIKQTETKIASAKEALMVAVKESETSRDNLSQFLAKDLISMEGFVAMSNEAEMFEVKVNHIRAYLNSENSGLSKMNQELAELNSGYGAILKRLQNHSVVLSIGKKWRNES